MSDDEEIFEPSIPVSPHERGESFGMTAACYQRMAACAMRASEYGHVDPVLIRKRAGGGCELVLFGSGSQYTLRVSTASAPARISLYYLPLDSRLSGPGCELFVGFDRYQDWHTITSMMIWREGRAGSEELLEWAEICQALAEGNGWEPA